MIHGAVGILLGVAVLLFVKQIAHAVGGQSRQFTRGVGAEFPQEGTKMATIQYRAGLVVVTILGVASLVLGTMTLLDSL